jgi:hypothetical protein
MTTMNLFGLSLIFSIISVLASFAANKHEFIGPRPSQEPAPPGPCSAPPHRQFDFWLGDWDAVDHDNPATVVARTKVDRILDGCVLREDYQGTEGLNGQSFTIYDAPRATWHQSWVTNRGTLLVIEGAFRDGEMVLSGSQHTSSGEKLIRGTWKPVDGGVREVAVTSTDGGRTWKPWFDLLFRPHKP